MYTRRQTLKLTAGVAATLAFDYCLSGRASAQTEGMNNPSATSRFDPTASENAYAVGKVSNFKAIYDDSARRAAFFLFLKNVYNIYPEDSFHRLIESATQAGKTDREIYAFVQSRQKSIEPIFSQVRYALPALARQKGEMARETVALLGARRPIDGYMEIGTTGRYVSRLRSSITFAGDTVLLNAAEPTYSPVDIVERGQLSKIGRYVPLRDYLPITRADVGDSSLDVVANFIGFHHSPPDRRDGFVDSVRRVLRPGGRLILRDHDVNSVEMNHMVALAHDVFNMGLGAPWDVNQREIRNFTSVDEVSRYLESRGFRMSKAQRPLLQSGDPTHNALMEFVKI